MNLHEYQSKKIFAKYGIPVPAGEVASTPEEAVEAAKTSRRRGLGRQGAGARRWPRQGRRRQGRARSRQRAQCNGRHARPASGHQADRARGAAGQPGLCRDRLRDRTRDLSQPHAQPREGPHCSGCLRRGRHGHRGRRRTRAGENPLRDDSSRRGSRGLSGARAGLRARAHGRADRAVRQDIEGALPALHRQRCEPGRSQSADRHQATARWSRSMPRSASIPMRCSAIRISSRCATARRKTRSRHARPSTTSTTSRSTAISPAWSTAPVLRWRRWTSSSCMAASPPTSSTWAVAQRPSA